MQNITDNELLDFIDGTGNERDRARIENGIAIDTNIKKRYDELQSVNHFLQGNNLASPSKNFTDRVMSNLHVRPATFLLSPKNGLILLAGLLIASILALILTSSGTFDQWHGLVPFNSSPLKNKWVTLPSSVPFDIKLFVKAVVLVNAALALLLLDRTILRPYFQKRKFS
jgi:anti-sigma factor RsiW